MEGFSCDRILLRLLRFRQAQMVIVQVEDDLQTERRVLLQRQQKHNAITKYKMFHLRSFMILPWQPVTGKEGSVALPERL